MKAILIASLLLLTVGLLIRLYVEFSGTTAKLQMPLFLRSDTDAWSANLPPRHDSEWRSWLAQSDIHVSAIVFYGRRELVRVLDPYLKRNLVSAGGLLEEVCCHVKMLMPPRSYMAPLRPEPHVALGRMGRPHR